MSLHGPLAFRPLRHTAGSPMSVREALQLINQVLDEALAEQESDFDAETRFALRWLEQYGMAEGPFGDAETLSKAMAVSVGGVVEAGILKAGAGKVRLLKRDELPEEWDPMTDFRLVVWEVTQYLIRTLDQDGEMAAAVLLGKVGSMGEIARNPAYRLYATCERKKWAQEALAYSRGLEDLAPYNIFHWSLTHQHAVVDAHLANFRGTVVGEAFSGYTQIGQRSEGCIVHASCNAHARREFVEAGTSEPIQCAQALSFYGQYGSIAGPLGRCRSEVDPPRADCGTADDPRNQASPPHPPADCSPPPSCLESLTPIPGPARRLPRPTEARIGRLRMSPRSTWRRTTATPMGRSCCWPASA